MAVKTDKILITLVAILFGFGIATGDLRIIVAFLSVILGIFVLYFVIYVATRAYYRAKARAKEDK